MTWRKVWSEPRHNQRVRETGRHQQEEQKLGIMPSPPENLPENFATERTNGTILKGPTGPSPHPPSYERGGGHGRPPPTHLQVKGAEGGGSDVPRAVPYRAGLAGFLQKQVLTSFLPRDPPSKVKLDPELRFGGKELTVDCFLERNQSGMGGREKTGKGSSPSFSLALRGPLEDKLHHKVCPASRQCHWATVPPLSHRGSADVSSPGKT